MLFMYRGCIIVGTVLVLSCGRMMYLALRGYRKKCNVNEYASANVHSSYTKNDSLILNWIVDDKQCVDHKKSPE